MNLESPIISILSVFFSGGLAGLLVAWARTRKLFVQAELLVDSLNAQVLKRAQAWIESQEKEIAVLERRVNRLESEVSRQRALRRLLEEAFLSSVLHMKHLSNLLTEAGVPHAAFPQGLEDLVREITEKGTLDQSDLVERFEHD